MKTFLKALALLAAITSVVWIAVIWRWQVTHRDMTADDLVIYLVILPLVVFAIAVALRWAVLRAMARQAAAGASAAAAATPAAAADAAAAPAESQERGLAWPLLGAWVAGAAGDDMAGVLDAAKAGKPAPAPDPALCSGKGMPVVCASVAGMDTEPVQEAWAEWRSRNGAAPHQLPAHVMRALAALTQVVTPAAGKIKEWWQALPEERRRVARVRVLVAWPEGWVDVDQAWLGTWLKAQWLEPGAERWMLQHLPPGSGPQAWQQADRLLLTLERERCDDLVLLLACHSDLSEPAVQAMEERGLLFCSDDHPKGQMPGEGAAALLLARSGPLEQAGKRDAMAWLHRPALVRRDKSGDAPGRISPDFARQAAEDAIAAAGVDAADFVALCSDGDRHSPRATELFGTTIALLPTLDPVEDMRLIGVVQGYAAHTGALWAVAGAALQAQKAERPALALSLADPHWRMAVVARHAPAGPPAAAKA